jgi:predicted transposase/invertase (TIGR01784 family)
LPPARYAIERMGIEQGIEQGEDRATQTIALNLLRKNISLETIAEVTGLTIERLQQLQASQVDG